MPAGRAWTLCVEVLLPRSNTRDLCLPRRRPLHLGTIGVHATAGCQRYRRISPGRRGIALHGGALLLAYWDLGLGQLRAVRCERQPARCSAPTLLDRGGRRDLSDFGAGAFPDLRAPPQGLGGAAGGGAVLAYFVEGDSGGELRLLSCPDANCTAPRVSTGARGGAGFGRDASVAFAPGALLVTLLDLQGTDSPLRMAARLAVFRPGSARERSSLESAARGLPAAGPKVVKYRTV